MVKIFLSSKYFDELANLTYIMNLVESLEYMLVSPINRIVNLLFRVIPMVQFILLEASCWRGQTLGATERGTHDIGLVHFGRGVVEEIPGLDLLKHPSVVCLLTKQSSNP